MLFSSIPGLASVKQHLIDSIRKERIAHAQLLYGANGCAMLPIVIAYVQYLMCEHPKKSDNCNTCDNCRRIIKNIHPDIHWFYPKPSTTNSTKYEKLLAELTPIWNKFMRETPYGSIDDWIKLCGLENKNPQLGREDSRQILSRTHLKRVENKFKIIIVWAAELLNNTAANSLLKVLEEPPQDTLFFFISTHYERIIQTIRSRTQLIYIPPTESSDIKSFLITRHQIEEKNASQATTHAQGSVGKALELIKVNDTEDYLEFRNWMVTCWKKDYLTLINNSEKYGQLSKNEQVNILSNTLDILRKVILTKYSKFSGSANKDEKENFLRDFSNNLSDIQLTKISEITNNAINQLYKNAGAKILHFNLSLEITKILETNTQSK